jgi:alcohol dehydrogenase class IV
MRESGVIDKIKNIVPHKTHLIIYDKVFAEPDTKIVDEGIKLARENKCDLVIGLGGGSALDVAKAIAGLIKEKNFTSSSEYQEGIGKREISSQGVPFIAIPTTSGTGAEVTKNAVLYNHEKKVKKSIRSPLLFAKTAIIDPLLSLSLPPKITAYSGMDALAHLIEGYISKQSTFLTDILAIQGIKLVGQSLREAVENGNNISAREAMALASLLGGIVIAHSGPTLAHGVASCLSNIAHGLATGILLPYAMQFNLNIVAKKFKTIAEALNVDFDLLDNEMRALNRAIGIPEKLGAVGVKVEDIKTLARKSLSASSTKRNPKPLTEEEMIKFLRQAI